MSTETMFTAGSTQPLNGRVAVITGASSGIGEASAEHLASLGATVAVLARRADRLDDLVARIDKNGGTAVAIAADVTDAAAVQAAADRVDAELGGADLLFNNAGVMLPAPIEERRTGQWQQQIDLNISGLMNVIGSF
ncbi:SDR family oxidoreductase, partial [Streptomyces sp. NPDC102274]|uniref:SDR family oxidoreductase n=1 Tax=Streptomyces sp. NPDC102274 TaxID=3366151 RepID=UPI003827F8BF